MTNNNLSKISFLKKLQIRSLEAINVVRKIFGKFDTLFPNTSQTIQLSFIYYFALVDLIYGVLTNVLTLGYYPELLKPFDSNIRGILTNPFFQMWNSPEKIFFLSFLVIEFMITRPVLKFSKLIKYNVLLIFALLMVQGLVLSYWDLLFHREIANGVSKWIMDESGFIYTDRLFSVFTFFITFIVFCFLYFYLYTRAIQNKFATLPGLYWLTDSIAFWLKIKTPTMRLGFRKKQKDN